MNHKQIWGLFELREDGKWHRLYLSLAYTKERAVRVFQDHLLAYALYGHPYTRCLKPVGHEWRRY